MDVGCHVLDRIDYLCGPLVDVRGTAEHRGESSLYEVEDYVHLDAAIGASDWAAIPSDGATVSCTWDFSGKRAASSNEETDLLEIVGPKGSLRMAAMSASLPVTVCDASGQTVREAAFAQPEHTAQAMIQAITDELRGKGSAPFVSRADNAIRTSRVIDAALVGYYGKTTGRIRPCGPVDDGWSQAANKQFRDTLRTQSF